MRINLEIIHADVIFPLHLFILRGEDIYLSQVYPLLIFPAKLWYKPLIFPHLFSCEHP